ncbi:hypothetical protein M2271_006962 [Streptomyces sp. LBL]|nr:hypothetical protein [Streptomyces sp. LBL]MDH6629126.1 hypothetical protein [Streptomyces sp. LBL]
MREPDRSTLVVCRMLVRLVVAEGADRPVMLDLSAAVHHILRNPR